MKKITALVMHCDTPNRNGRIYSFDTMDNEIKRMNDKIKQYGCVLGCIGGVNTFNGNTDLSEVSHKITKVYSQGDSIHGIDVYFDGEILNTPNGKILEEIGIDKLGCEMLGYGELGENGVVNNFELSRIDLIEKEKCAWEMSYVKERVDEDE